jgi:hypothetical protein
MPAPPAHQPQPRAQTTPHRRPRKRRFFKVLAMLIILGVLAGGAALAYPRYFAKSPFPSDVRSQAKYTVFYPAQLPAGYTVDRASISTLNGILVFSASKDGQKLAFSQQKVPKNFDFGNFYKTALVNKRQFSTSYGQAAVGMTAGHYLGSLVAGDTWLLLSTDSASLSAEDLTNVLTHLKKY